MIGAIVVLFINSFRAIGNAWRALLRRRADIVRLDLAGPLPEFAEAQPWWRKLLGGPEPQSLAGLRRQLERIAADPNARGVLLHLNGFSAGWGTLQSLHDELRRFRAAGKRVTAYVLTLDNASYYAACAADEIIAPPSATFGVLGLRVEVQFLRDALAKVGISAEVEAVSPYKTAYDGFVRADISPENRAQLERILDQRYAELLRAIGEGRGKTAEEVAALIDRAPLSGPAALQAGLLDALCYEDELAERFKRGEQPGRIEPWNEARRSLRIPYARRFRRLVAVVPVEGAIMMGSSRNMPVPLPLIGGRQAGADTVAQALRQAERNPRIAAAVVFINSPGGDAYASDLMWRELLRLRRKKPVVVVMGDVAASGGYYLAAPASAIVAQPGTLTGSIGVVSLRPLASELLQRAGINTVTLSRGAHSGLFSVREAPSESERQAIRAQVLSTYEEFKERVRDGRGLSEEQLEPIAGGRVWTGQEALGLRLVDQLGGLPEGHLKAQELAGLPQDRSAPMVLLRGGRGRIPPQPFPAGALLETLQLLDDVLKPRIWALLPFEGL